MTDEPPKDGPMLEPDPAVLPGKHLLAGSIPGYGTEPFNNVGYGR